MKNKILAVMLLMVSLNFAYSATGGTITTDGIYTIHTFASNGTFNITGEITGASILIIAGGGSGAYDRGGGGGAGGLIFVNETQNISAGNYNVVVGKGGNT